MYGRLSLVGTRYFGGGIALAFLLPVQFPVASPRPKCHIYFRPNLPMQVVVVEAFGNTPEVLEQVVESLLVVEPFHKLKFKRKFS